MARELHTEVGSGLTNLAKTSHSLSQKIDMIDRTSWADEFSWDQSKILARYMEAHRVEKGTTILHERGDDAHMILIIQGRVDIVKEDNSNVQKAIATLGPGRTFGEMSLIDGEPRSASAVAATDVLLFVLSKDSFVRLTENSPHLALSLVLKISKLMSHRLRLTLGKLIDYV
jgi:CRP-like cAMP-binding protein